MRPRSTFVKIALILTAGLGASCRDAKDDLASGNAKQALAVVGQCLGGAYVDGLGVGAVRIGASISRLPRGCTSRDTTLSLGEGMSERAWVVSSLGRSVIALAAPSGDATIRRVLVEGPEFHTAKDVRIGSSIATLRASHPPLCALMGDDGRVVMVSGALAGVSFETNLTVPSDPAARRGMEEDASRVPADAKVERMWITGAESPCVGPTIAEQGLGTRDWGLGDAFTTVSYLRSATPSQKPLVPSPQSLVPEPSRLLADTIWSQVMATKKQFLVYLPASYGTNPSRRYPVAYYLHGMWGSERQWPYSDGLGERLDSLVAAGAAKEMILVFPDGDDGWYTTWNFLGDAAACRRETWRHRNTPATDESAAEPADAYCVAWPKYDDFIARELVAYVDRKYRTAVGREHRGIAGLSMGGYGAVALALNYPDVFSAAASHSGLLAPLLIGPTPFAAPARYARNEAELRQAASGLWWAMSLAFGRDTSGWWARDPGRLAARILQRGGAKPALSFDVGRDDRWADQNRAFHATLDSMGYAHRFAEFDGGHTHAYWRKHSAESLVWLSDRIGQ